ncbi:SDR family NAD(P)-dependent oxidoreductase [Paramicrobacterium agarici]
MALGIAGKVAVVTGSSHGIGRAIALALAAEGAKVTINSIDDADEAAGTLQTLQSHTDAIHVEADVTQPAGADELVGAALREYGQVDMLVNNVGGGKNVPFSDLTLEEFERVLMTNLRGAFLMTSALIDGMAARGFGRIINISSQLGIKGGRELAHYTTAKAGLIGFTKSLALDYATTGVTVNAIAPGRISTEREAGKARVSEEWLARKRQEIAMQRFGRTDEVSATAVLIASSPGGDFYTGQTFHPNGGDVMP